MQTNVLIPLIVACALFMENMDSTVITTSLPAIALDLGVNPISLKLALTSYLVSLAVFIPISGWIADRFGTRRVFALAIVVFVGSSALCAFSGSLPGFVAARLLQGMGGAMMVPVGRLVLMRSIPKHQYVAALNYLTIPALLGPVTGPALGGAITLYFHWRWIFLINLPIGALGLYLVLRHIPDLRAATVARFDVRGFVLSSVGLASLMLGLSALGGHLLGNEAIAAAIVGGSVILGLYVVHARHTEHPVIDLRLFRLPTFFHGVVVGNFFRTAIGATPFLLPLLLQLGFGLNPLQSGILTCSTAIGAMFMKTLTVRILRRYGFRRVLVVNGLIASLSVALYGAFTAATPHAVIAAILLITGCMRSLQFTALQAVSFADIDASATSQAASITSMAQRLAQSLGIAAGGYMLELSGAFSGHQAVVASDFVPVFLGIAALSLVAPLWHLRMPRDAGRAVSGHLR